MIPFLGAMAGLRASIGVMNPFAQALGGMGAMGAAATGKSGLGGLPPLKNPLQDMIQQAIGTGTPPAAQTVSVPAPQIAPEAAPLAPNYVGGAPGTNNDPMGRPLSIGPAKPQQATPAPQVASAPQQGRSALPASFTGAMNKYEGAGDPDTLFGHRQKSGQFAGTRVSQMTVGQAMQFSDPSGPYAQSVKGQIGRVATPMGTFQIVGQTLRRSVKELGIDPNTPFNAETQSVIAAHLASKRLAASDTMSGKIAGLRSEWEGFKHVPQAQMEQIVRDLESGRGGLQAMAQGLNNSQQIRGMQPTSGGAQRANFSDAGAPNAQPTVTAPGNNSVAQQWAELAKGLEREKEEKPVARSGNSAPVEVPGLGPMDETVIERGKQALSQVQQIVYNPQAMRSLSDAAKLDILAQYGAEGALPADPTPRTTRSRRQS